MPITVLTGRAGSGKTAYLCQILVETLERNTKYYARTKKVRKVWVNFPLSKTVEEKFKGFIEYFETMEQLIRLEDCDIFIDELLYYFDAQMWKETSSSTKRFLAIHRHLGVEIYATSQDFAQVDVSFRRLTDTLFYLVKIISSREPSATKPPVKYIWGVSAIYTIPPTDYKENQKENTTSFHWLFFLTRKKCEVYDTRQKFEPVPPAPYKHIIRKCEDPRCTIIGEHGKVIHI